MAAADEALRAATDFISAFNAQDARRLAATLNYPHIRLASGDFMTIATPEEFIERSERGRARLEAEHWHHTVVRSIQVVHAGEDKVHIALTNDRCHADGTVYNSFDTLWIATRMAGHWGIQFRSSFLTS
ncbi:MAG: hypothetical protein O3B31_06565 [Chloroflexi bacterium]|nr:hypothetical protein [Chloroflexota bacterium]